MISNYIRCPSCGKVVNDETYSLAKLSNPSPCCGAVGEVRSIWPGLEGHKLLEIVDSQSFQEHDQRRIAIVFLASFIEYEFEGILWDLIGKHARVNILAESLLAAELGRERRIALFCKLRNKPLKDILSEQDKGHFMDDWKALATLRNGILHKNYFSGHEDEPSLLGRLRREVLPSLMVIQNDIADFLPTKNPPSSTPAG